MQLSTTAPSTSRRWYTSGVAVTGIAYSLSWIAGLSLGAPSPEVNASGERVVAAFTGHEGVVAAQFVFTEGLPAVGLAIVSLALARAARRRGAVTAARVAAVAGVLAATVSLTQFVLGVTLSGSTAPGTAHALFESVNRLDGVKMFVLAALAEAGVASCLLPRWLRYAAGALAVAIIVSGVGYLLLIPSLATVAYLSGVLLLLFVTGTAVVLGRTAR